MERTITLNTDDMGCEHGPDNRVTCGTCQRNWCDICNPTPSARCPYEYEHTGDEYRDSYDYDQAVRDLTSDDLDRRASAIDKLRIRYNEIVNGVEPVSRQTALSMIGLVWAGNCGEELFRLFESGDYRAAYAIAIQKVADQEKIEQARIGRAIKLLTDAGFEVFKDGKRYIES